MLGLTYVIVDGAFLAAYGKGAGWLAARLKDRYRPLVDRAAGVSLIAAAVLLGLRGNER